MQGEGVDATMYQDCILDGGGSQSKEHGMAVFHLDIGCLEVFQGK